MATAHYTAKQSTSRMSELQETHVAAQHWPKGHLLNSQRSMGPTTLALGKNFPLEKFLDIRWP